MLRYGSDSSNYNWIFLNIRYSNHYFWLRRSFSQWNKFIRTAMSVAFSYNRKEVWNSTANPSACYAKGACVSRRACLCMLDRCDTCKQFQVAFLSLDHWRVSVIFCERQLRVYLHLVCMFICAQHVLLACTSEHADSAPVILEHPRHVWIT